MPGKRRRRTASEDGGAAPSWTTTYGDMVTLLLTFFVMLFAFSTLDAARFQALVVSLQGSLGVLDRGMTISQESVVGGRESPQGQIYQQHLVAQDSARDLFEAVWALQERFGLYEAFSIETAERGVIIHFTDRVLFDTGKAELKPEAREVLGALAAELAKLPHHIRVEGHTDNVPINNSQFPSNWELSVARAVVVLRFLINSGGLDPGRLSAVGYGEFRPIASNETPEGRARNRRVDIVLLNDELAASEPVSAVLRQLGSL